MSVKHLKREVASIKQQIPNVRRELDLSQLTEEEHEVCTAAARILIRLKNAGQIDDFGDERVWVTTSEEEHGILERAVAIAEAKMG